MKPNRRGQLPDGYSLAGPSVDATRQNLDTVGTPEARKSGNVSSGSAMGYVNHSGQYNNDMCGKKLVVYVVVVKKHRARSGDNMDGDISDNVNADETAIRDQRRESDAPKFVDNDLYATCI